MSSTNNSPRLANSVLEKFVALKESGYWPAEPELRPSIWINNFDKQDQPVAALLLDRFTYIGDKFTDRLLVASYNNLGDGRLTLNSTTDQDQLSKAIENCVFTPALGEEPNPTDSGNLMCRKLRQIVKVPESKICDYSRALDHAYAGKCVVFVDDFIGSGEQYTKTFGREENNTGRSFQDALNKKKFIPVYICLVSTKNGYTRIRKELPDTILCCTHVLDKQDTIWGIEDHNIDDYLAVLDLLERYEHNFQPSQKFMQTSDNKLYGFNRCGVMMAFKHSVPDATLPIFWASGVNNNWEPLIERS